MSKKSTFLKNQVRTNSEPTTGAHTPTMCALGTAPTEALLNKYNNLLSSKSLSLFDSLAIDLLLSGGIRISELLQIRYNDITALGQVRIHALKGSSDRLISSMYHAEMLIKYRHLNGFLFEGYSRWYFHRLFVKLGFYQLNNGSNKRVTTHIFRHHLVTDLQNQFNQIELTQSTIGHKRQSSTEWYINKNKKSCQ
jgi:site-specific recombinase XerD